MRSFVGSILAVLRNNEISQLSTSFGMVVARPVRAGRATIASRHACSAAQQMSGTYHLDLAIRGPKSDPRPAAAAFPPGTCLTLGNSDYSTARRYLP